MDLHETINKLIIPTQPIQVYTLGTFKVIREGKQLLDKDWGRDKTLQLFQFMVTSRSRGALHKEQIMDRLWDDYDDKTFKVAMHGINKTLEPDRPSRVDPKYVTRSGLSYQLSHQHIWVDAEVFEALITMGNKSSTVASDSIEYYRSALELYKGHFLPSRIYEDWSTAERERLQILAVGAYTQLAELLLSKNPQESIRLCQEALTIDNVWEEAYRIQMKAYVNSGNRPLAIKTYERCKSTLNEEFGIDPLPVTKALLEEIKRI